jgi:hypothetical protein
LVAVICWLKLGVTRIVVVCIRGLPPCSSSAASDGASNEACRTFDFEVSPRWPTACVASASVASLPGRMTWAILDMITFPLAS